MQGSTGKVEKAHNPFKGDYQYFSSIHPDQRSNWIYAMLETPQKEGEPKIFKLDYPNNAPWEYQGVVYNYYFAEESNNPKAVLVHLHGLNSHGGASGYFGVNLAKTCGINVYALDFKNFGQSGGDERGYIESFEDTVKTAEEFIKFIFNKYKGKPRLFLSGNSFGGSIAVQLAINTPKIYRGLVLFVPAIREVRESQYFMKKLGLAMGYMFPKLKLLNQSFDSGTKFKIGHHILADKNNYTAKIVPGSVRTVLNAMAELQTKFGLLDTPYILFQSGIDKLVDPFAALDLEKESPAQDKTTIYSRTMWHSVFNEQEIEYIVPLAIEWVRERI